MGSKVTPQTTTTETRLPSWLEPAMQRGVDRAEGVYGRESPEAVFNPFGAQTRDSLGMMEDIARGGGNVQPAMNNYNAVLGGDFLHGGQGFDAALGAAENRIIPQVQSMFSRGGRTNSGLAQVGMAKALGDSFAGLYDNERGRQMQALSMAPQMEQLAYNPARMLGQVGQIHDAKTQEYSDIAQYNANAPARSLDEYLQRIQGIAPHAGGIQSNTRPIYENKTNQLLGLGATGAGLIFGGAPFAAGGSGLLGLLRGS